MLFYVKYDTEILKYNYLCPALQFIKYVGGELFFTEPKEIKQMELF